MDEGVSAFVRAMQRGAINEVDARLMMEHSPRLVTAICDGGPLSGAGAFLAAAKAGTLTAAFCASAFR